MSCPACGGDGQIEYGAYRGDDDTTTRECRLCGGKPTSETYCESVSGSRGVRTIVESLDQLGRTTKAAGASMEQVVKSFTASKPTRAPMLSDTNQMSGDEIMNALLRSMK